MKNYQQKPVEPTRPKKDFESAKVRDYMVSAKELITFRPDTDIREVVKTLLANRITGAPVLDDSGNLVGLIDDKDCLKVIFDTAYHDQPIHAKTVDRFMTNVLKTISVDADIYDVANLFLTTPYKRLLIVDDDEKLVGQISRRDILRAIHDVNKNAK
jgi:predicted transcriptional regulator